MDTRSEVLRRLYRRGAQTASALATDLELTVPGVRRHLDALLEEGLIEVAPAIGTVSGKGRGRGRPATAYRLSDLGRDQFGHNYDELAVDALDALREIGGEEAVRSFAAKRVAAILAHAKRADNPVESTQSVADAFTSFGYAAEVRRSRAGVQLCTHHCPISEVASQFPEFCAAEQEAISQFIGHRVQPLATIAGGHGICTTNVSLPTHQPTDQTDKLSSRQT